MRGQGFIRNSSVTTIVKDKYREILVKLNMGSGLTPDEKEFVVHNEDRFSRDINCIGPCTAAIANIHIEAEGGGRRRTRRTRRRKTRGGVNKPGYRDTNPEDAPSGAQGHGTAVLARLAAENQGGLASTRKITGLPRVTEDSNENSRSTSTWRRKEGRRPAVKGLFGRARRRITRRR